MASGDNRYLKVLLFYYFPRAMIVSLFFMVSNLLNKRTYKLLDKEIKVENGGNVNAATEVGTLVAKRALALKIEAVVFDRGGYLYHGRVKALAEAARAAGLKF